MTVDLNAPTCSACATRDGVRTYLVGPLCLTHSPAGLNGRTVPVPDPTRTAAALSTRVLPAREPRAYGPAGVDLRVSANLATGFRTGQHCPECTYLRPVNHDGAKDGKHR